MGGADPHRRYRPLGASSIDCHWLASQQAGSLPAIVSEHGNDDIDGDRAKIRSIPAAGPIWFCNRHHQLVRCPFTRGATLRAFQTDP
jgi:hypothetical protein